MNNHAKGFDPGLGRVFNFDAADLDANRAGRLSEQQELILRNTVRVQVRHASRALVMVAALILLWVGAIVIWGVRKGRRHTEAVTNARVHLVEGEVRVEPAYSGEHYWAHIGQVRFGIDTDQWDGSTTTRATGCTTSRSTATPRSCHWSTCWNTETRPPGAVSSGVRVSRSSSPGSPRNDRKQGAE